MLQTVEGRYENGRVLIKERPTGIRCARVLVTFIDEAPEAQAAPTGLLELPPRERAVRVAEIQDQWRSRLSSSEGFSLAKAEEIDLEERARGGRDG